MTVFKAFQKKLFKTPPDHWSGHDFEDEAARLLKKKHFRILERNWSRAGGEIDIIALDKDVLVFVEVKGRRHEGWGSGAEAVNRDKQRKIIKVSESFIRLMRCQDAKRRYDVISIHLEEGQPKIQHFVSAF